MPAPTSKPSAPSTTPTEVHLQTLLERVPVCLMRAAHDGTLLAVNDAALVLLGAEGLHEVLGTRLQSFVEGDVDACRRFIERIAGGERGSMELTLRSLAGGVSTLQVNATPVPGAVDGITSALLAFRDVSEQRRLERSVVEAAAGPGSGDAEGLASAVARIEELEQALQESEARRLELEALLGERDGMSIDLDAAVDIPARKGKKGQA